MTGPGSTPIPARGPLTSVVPEEPEALLLTEPVLSDAWPPPLRRKTEAAGCKVCKRADRPLEHGVCSWCCAPVEESEQG